MLLGLAAAIATFLLANNLLTGFGGFLKHVEEAVKMNVDNRTFRSDLQGQLFLLLRCFKLFLIVLGPSVALVLLGLTHCLRRRQWTALGLLFLPILGHHLVILSRFGWVYPRFLLGASVFLVILSGAAIDSFPKGVAARLVQVTAALSLLYGISFSVSLDYALSHDARYAAEEWIRTNVKDSSRFETYAASKRYLPRVWDKHEITRVGASGMTRSELIRRNPDYVIVFSLFEATLRRLPQAGGYLADLEQGRSGYSVVAEFETPTLRIFPVRMIFGVAPRITILGREEDPPNADP
jgi:hypothetical protein